MLTWLAVNVALLYHCIQAMERGRGEGWKEEGREGRTEGERGGRDGKRGGGGGEGEEDIEEVSEALNLLTCG